MAEAEAGGSAAIQLSTSLEGEARELGRLVANLARGSAVEGAPFQPPIVLVGCGGESGVTLAPGTDFGTGGPNQEAAIGRRPGARRRPGGGGDDRHRRLRRRHRAGPARSPTAPPSPAPASSASTSAKPSSPTAPPSP